MQTLENDTTVADVYLRILADRGVEYLFANAGTDFAPLIEAYAKAEAEGAKVPKPVTVPHENVAVAMAMGHYLKSGRPQLVMVHVNVGTANSVCGVMNASRANIPVLFSAGRTPFTESGDVPGGRSGEIHWPQEMRDQASILREFVKWDYQLPNGKVLENTVDRAINMASAEPKGPIYLTLPREVLAAPANGIGYHSPSRHRTASPPFPDLRAIDEAADMIAKAKNPLIITSSAGRDEGDAERLAALADAFAIPVTQRKPRYTALSTDHAMHLGYDPDSMLAAADLVIVIECDVPWVPFKQSPAKDAKIIHIGVDPLFSHYPMRAFDCDLAITGVLSATLTQLTQALATRQTAAIDSIEERRLRLIQQRTAQRDKWREALKRARNNTPMSPAWISHCIDAVKGEDGIVIKESPLQLEQMRFTKPGTMYSIGAAGGLGWGLGTALGVKTAAPDKLVICTVGDGAYMFGNPIPAHYVSAAEKLPILTVVFNNQMWGAVKRNTREVYPDGFAARSNREPLTYFDPALDFSKAAEIAGGYGETVEDPAHMEAALERSLKVIGNEKRQVVLNVVCGGP
ncbi:MULTISPECIES: thiamine pyrophosphate-requiring protein [unclassified Beijerinckia]|uniref:thiamine pyrophosphate-requiring protein n=1 Tax=unclassified Beijerinckia TaxID=2638183 RepID=UPI0008950ABD|nr:MULTISPECIES: thiamine pyrophosphate-requiring protein [unclassified Beijerinckia]MDH7794248.1 acetolactate synthase-1/2/3 large subunit [Beijerinckia sp. GAS462]SEB56798.1 acetolactate synthase-1/2/3 large subunit [Beijerinckia sp. 28-YEA-48]